MVVSIIALFFAVVLHEMGHAAAALMLGDDTAKKQKRFYLHTHFDLFGSFILPLILYLCHAPFLFGYAKPVRVDIRKLKDSTLDFALIGLAGPFTNFVLAFLSSIIIKSSTLGTQFLTTFMMINLGLGFFNLIPIPPLDGSRVLLNMLPPKPAIAFTKLESVGIFLVFGLQILTSQISNFTGVKCSLFYIFVECPVRYAIGLLF